MAPLFEYIICQRSGASLQRSAAGHRISRFSDGDDRIMELPEMRLFDEDGETVAQFLASEIAGFSRIKLPGEDEDGEHFHMATSSGGDSTMAYAIPANGNGAH